MRINEIKQRLDPACWTGKKIGNPRTKVKGGVRVNNCVPAESVEEDLSRRGFLKGLGAAAVAGAAGGIATKADAQQVSQWVKYATDLATRSMGRIHQDTGYDLRNWLVNNVGTWVSNYCTQTNSYNAKNVIDYCNQQGVEASGLDKQNALVTAFLTNMKDRYQDFLNAYRAGINESYQKYNAALQSQQQQQKSMGGLSQEEFDTLIDGLMLYAFIKDSNNQNSELGKEIIKTVTDFVTVYNLKEYVNSIYPKVRQSLAQVKQNPEMWKKETDRLVDIVNPTIIKLKSYAANKQPEFKESVDQGVAEDYSAEYDDEAGMAQGSLHTLKNAVEGLSEIIDAGDNLPEWCQEKISLAEDYLVTVWDYIQSEKAQGVDPEINELAEEFDMIERIIESIAAHNGVDADEVWTDLESLTEDELYAFAVTSQLNEDWQKANKRDRTDGMSQKAVNAYRRENPGSKLKTAVTTKPSKLKKGSKASKRRKSYCSRSRGQMKMHGISCAKTPDKAICKARRRWNC